MVRFLVVVFSILGVAFLLSTFFPTLTHVAFQVAGIGITWMMMIAAGVGVAAFKVTK